MVDLFLNQVVDIGQSGGGLFSMKVGAGGDNGNPNGFYYFTQQLDIRHTQPEGIAIAAARMWFFGGKNNGQASGPEPLHQEIGEFASPHLKEVYLFFVGNEHGQRVFIRNSLYFSDSSNPFAGIKSAPQSNDGVGGKENNRICLEESCEMLDFLLLIQLPTPKIII
jgi:hypothetical protein